jgi:hypothetical protein
VYLVTKVTIQQGLLSWQWVNQRIVHIQTIPGWAIQQETNKPHTSQACAEQIPSEEQTQVLSPKKQTVRLISHPRSASILTTTIAPYFISIILRSHPVSLIVVPNQS